ncbi:Agamous-like MADS-box protein AGL61 [Platanthera guangdongensis]|uniref:Agamous-like MADS-box protein AGL61 n=1 Tax=Platanthera guangdongensis TaxID=2320717 RepID=A0ABR2MSK4_9ASPA
MTRKKRQSMGRQKIAMKIIEREEARQVCFSKRRAGLFKKATELSILGGAGAPPQLHGIRIDGDKLHRLNEEHTGLTVKLEEARRRRAELEMAVAAQQVAPGLDMEVQQMTMEELESFHNTLEELRRNVASRREELEMLSAVEAKPIRGGPGAMFGYGFGYLGGMHNGLYLPAGGAGGLYGQYGVPDQRAFPFWG